MKRLGRPWVGGAASQPGLSRTCRVEGGRKPQGRAERSGAGAAASAQVQGWKVPDRRAEGASSLPPSLPHSPRPRALHAAGLGGSLCQRMLWWPPDTRGGSAGGEEGRGRSLSFPAGLGLHRLCIHSKAAESKPAAPSSLLSKDPAVHGRTDPSSQHGSAALWCHQPGPHMAGDGPWGGSEPPEPGGPCPVPRQHLRSSPAAQPGAQPCCAGRFVTVPALPCAVPGPRVLTGPSLLPFPSSPSAPSPGQRSFTALIVTLPGQGCPGWHFGSAQLIRGIELLCQRSWTRTRPSCANRAGAETLAVPTAQVPA